MRELLAIQFHNAKEALISLDQFVNVLVCALTWRIGYSDETLSAHCWRSYRDGRVWGRLFMPPIDWLFSWQKLDPPFTDEQGNPITGHCRRAYMKEQERDYLPPEYRTPPTP